MKVAVFAVACLASASFVQAGQGRPSAPRSAAAPAAPSAAGRIAEAYAQFLLARHYEGEDDIDAAIAAYKRAIELDPRAADLPAELAALYLRQNKAQEAMAAAEQAVKIEPANREGNRVLGVIYAALAENPPAPGRAAAASDDNAEKAIRHLEIAHERAGVEAEPSMRATLARLYVSTGAFEKAIPVLLALVNQEPQWHDGAQLLAEAYLGAGRTREGIAWLQELAADDPRMLPTLADFYERERRWKEAADTYGKAIQLVPFARNMADLRTRYASALLNAGGREAAAKARDVLTGSNARGAKNGVPANPLRSTLPTDSRALYLLSQAHRRLGESAAAETSARALIAQNPRSPWGYYALAEALEEREQYQAVVDALAPAIDRFRPRGAGDERREVNMLLPHLGFAYQQLGEHEKAIAVFEEARRLAPDDPSLAGYLAEANIAAKKYATAAEIARAAYGAHPADLRLARVHAQALRHNGKIDEALAVLQKALAAHGDDPMAHVAVARMYSDTNRNGDAVKVLQDAQAKFPSDTAVAYELGAVLDKQKRYAEAERVFKEVLARDPENAAVLNYLGYMLAERGERLDESVDLLTKALQLQPDNGSILDSLGWAYFKADKLVLAEENLRRAADQLRTNSVIQDHYGDLLFKLGRLDEAIAAWTRALDGDGDSIDRRDIDRKIRAARQQVKK
ncbi:MAG: tetratricopeptide repeat protein [Acidobacteria bacterium]|nr:tetratricopeptide repeat protein [Acidobacteriota bacterium]